MKPAMGLHMAPIQRRSMHESRKYSPKAQKGKGLVTYEHLLVSAVQECPFFNLLMPFDFTEA